MYHPHLKAHYRFESTQANLGIDASGNGNHGTVHGATPGIGQFGGGADFVTNDYIDLGDSDDFSFTDGVNDKPFSISFWIKFNSISNQWIINKRGSGTEEWQIAYFNGALVFWLFGQGSSVVHIQRNYTFTPDTNKRYHVFCTYDGSGLNTGLNIFLDAAPVGIVGGGGGYLHMNNTSSPVNIGRTWFSTGFYLNGSLDEVKIFNKDYNNLIDVNLLRIGQNPR